jgi:GT2 family glycosyltransferase
MDLSIIIANWNTRDLLQQCLTSLYANLPGVKFEILVVDNASGDGSPAMVRECFPQVRLFENSRNLGFVQANNEAIPQSCGRYVLLLNSDTIVQPKALTHMIEFMDGHPEAGIVGGYILNADGTLQQHSYGKFPTLFSETFFAWGLDSRAPFSRWFAPRLEFSGEYVQTGWVIGAALLIRRDALNQVGLLDAKFLMYSEEVDWCYRVQQAGWKNYVLRAARIVHLGGQSSRQVAALTKAELFHSKVKYFRKHHSRWGALILSWIFGASILGRRWLYRQQGDVLSANLWAEVWKYFVARESKITRGESGV